MNKSLMILAALVAPSIGLAQDGPRPISLQEALDMAKKNAPSMVQARGSIRTSSAQLRQARWAFNPLNNVQLSYGSSTGGGGSYDSDGFFRERAATSWGFSQGFGGAELTIWDGGAKLATIRQRNAQLNQAEVGEVTQSFAIAQQVKTQYYAALSARESEGSALAQIAQAEQQMKAAVARFRAGTAIISDSLTAVVALGNGQLAVLNARNAGNNASAQLTRLTGAPYPVTAIVSDTTDPAPLRMTDADLFGLAERGPAVQSSASSVDVSRAAVKTSRAVLWPSVRATGSFGRSNSQDKPGGGFFSGYDFGAGKMNYSWSFGLSASYTLFNGFARESQILQSAVGLDNAEANLREAKLLARQNMTQQLGTLRTAEAQIVITRANLTAALEALRAQTQRYELGAGTLLEVLNAQATVTSQRASLISARFNARNARAAIESLIGRELPQ